MTPDRLLARFDSIVEAPAAIPRLRRFILDLAVRGKLVEHDPKDDSASELLKRIEIKKQAMSSKGERVKEDPRPIRTDEIPFKDSSDIVFARLSTIARIEKGQTGIQSATPGEFPLVTLAEDRATSAEYQFDAPAAIVPLISSTGHGHASLKRIHYQEGKFALGNILCAIIPYDSKVISARYIYEYLWAYKEPLLVEKMFGTANVSLSVGKIGEAPIPIISPRSQSRIAELMALCDQLEAAKATRETWRNQLVASSLNRLNNGVDAFEFREHARFYLNYLPRLSTRVEHFTQLRQMFLNLAVRGKLVPQDSNDEPASELLKRIPAENRKLQEEKGIRPQKGAEPNECYESATDIPTMWVHAYLQDLAYQITDGTHLTPKYTEKGKPFLSAQNVKPFRFIPKKHRFVSATDFENYRANRKPEIGDVLLTRVGAGIGESAVLDSDFEFAFYVSLCLIKIPTKYLLPEYLVIWLNSPEGRYNSSTRTLGKGASQGNLNLSLIRTFKIPLPPVAEQRRIVAKVAELMAICDGLETLLVNTETESSRLLEAVLHEAIAS